MLARFPLFPAAFAVAFILNRYFAAGGSLNVAVRPLIAGIGVSVLLQLILWFATRSRDVSGFIATVVLAVLVDPAAAILVTAGGGVVLAAKTIRRRRLEPLDWHRLTRVFNAISVAITLVAVGMIGLGGSVASTLPAIASGTPAPDAPDIYVILLDGHPRTDTLASTFGYDAGPFTMALNGLGFEEAIGSHSNYNATSLTLASLFNSRQVPELLGDRQEASMVTSDLLLRQANGGAALTWLREAGYHLVSIPSGVTSADITAVDTLLDPGQINSFEVSLMRGGLLSRLPVRGLDAWIYDQQRDRIHATFDLLPTIPAAPDHRPRFVFAHVMSPHAPILFDAKGAPVPPPACFPLTCDPWDPTPARSALVDQIRYLDTLVLTAVSRIISASPRPPVIVILSDHGSRLIDRSEMLRNLFFAATPRHPGLFPDNVTPINLIPRILNAYVNADLPLATEESYEVDLSTVPTRGYLPLVPYPQT